MRFLEDSGIFALPCISVPGGGQISKEVAKWNPTVVAPSFAKDTCASNINLKVGAAQVLKESRELQQETFLWETPPMLEVQRGPLRWRCLSSLDHYASGIKGNLLKTEFPDSWMGQELGLDML